MTNVVSRDREILGGTPVFAGTRVPVRNLIDCLEGGYTIDEFLEDFPTVSRDQVIAFLENTKAELELAVPAGRGVSLREVASDGGRVTRANQGGNLKAEPEGNGDSPRKTRLEAQEFLRARSNKIEDIRPLIPQILEALSVAEPGHVAVVE